MFTTERHYFSGRPKQKIEKESFNIPRVKKHINSTGYTWQELARIEFAFERAGLNRKDRMYIGLMNVVDVLADIHGIDLAQREESKKLFIKL